MRILLDTHILLWVLLDPRRLGQATRDVLDDVANVVLFSTVNIWEIAIKSALRRQGFSFRPRDIAVAAQATGFTELTIRSSAVCQVAELPHHHRDPFDRLLVAQAITEPASLYTADPKLALYSELVHLVT